ncbi:Alpha amylase [Parelusimicrobium proximum]|uniref:alpha-amylase family glycosyl hydrolase n=1 Tax=Parelusimicrobium proximum TaxID=3228953 RepID=UPI003D163438
MRTNPHIIEINTKLLLNRMRNESGSHVTLDTIPDSFWAQIKDWGFDAVWMLGVWTRSVKSREIAQNHEGIKEEIRAIDPNFSAEDIIASPFAVYDYNVDPDLGGNDAILRLKEKLNSLGISLLLDFVGNHMAIDHPMTKDNPSLFVNTGKNAPPEHAKNFFFKTDGGVYIAHGKDPYFPSWTDTAQLNYFKPETREYMLKLLEHVAQFCDGVRCDMAMLSLNKIHHDLWGEFIGHEFPKEEFWTLAVDKIREQKPEFIFIAEVYWGLEWDIQELGFDYTYDKVLYDRLRFSNAESIRGHLNAEHLFQRRSIRFTANHDEISAVDAFGREKSFAAAAIISTITGARMFHYAQLKGVKDRQPIQYLKNCLQYDDGILKFYTDLLHEVNNPEYHGGQWFLWTAHPAADSHTCQNVLVWVWSQANNVKIVMVNYSAETAVCKLNLSKMNTSNIKESFYDKPLEGNLTEILQTGVTLKPWEIKIFSLNGY